MPLKVLVNIQSKHLNDHTHINQETGHTQQARVKREQHEVLVIPDPQTVVDPGTVMVHLHNALVALRAVMGSFRFPRILALVTATRGSALGVGHVLVNDAWVCPACSDVRDPG